jgi:hypothetical protein
MSTVKKAHSRPQVNATQERADRLLRNNKTRRRCALANFVNWLR